MGVERKLIDENMKRLLMAEFLERETARAGFGGVEIQRTPLGLRIRLTAERPGFVIGRRGSTIQRITADLKELFDLENPQIEVEEADNPNLNPQIMAQKLAEALERGWHFRRAGHSTVRRIMDSGAKGVMIALTGKLTGSRGRMEKFQDGHIKFCGEPALEFMDRGYAVAKKKLGTIGVKVAIMRADAKLPDEITVLDKGAATDKAKQIAHEAIEDEAKVEAAMAEVEAGVAAQADAAPAAEVAGETPPPKPVAPQGGSKANKAKLTDIPGVGKAKATALEEAGFDYAAIVEASEAELAEVSGIGPKLAEKIKQAVVELEGGGAQ